MSNNEKIAKLNNILSKLKPLINLIDSTYNSSMDLLSVNFLEKYYFNLSDNEIQDVHNQWAEDASELKKMLKQFTNEIKHSGLLEHDDEFIKVIVHNLNWNISQTWEIITEKFSEVFIEYIKPGHDKWEIEFKDIDPKEILERIKIMNDDELESHIFKTYTETNDKLKGHSKHHTGKDNAIYTVSDWWIEVPGNAYFISDQSDMKYKITVNKMDDILRKLEGDDKFIQLDMYGFVLNLKLAVISDLMRLASIELAPGTWDNETVDYFVDVIKENDELSESLNNDVWEENLSIITNNLGSIINTGDKPQILNSIYSVVAKKNDLYKLFLTKLDLTNMKKSIKNNK